MRTIKVTALSLFLGVAGIAYADHSVEKDMTKKSQWQTVMSKAMNAEIRSEKDVMRDENRKPIETLEFFGFADDMSVIELIPGGGWYSKLLAPTLAKSGKYYAGMFAGRMGKSLSDKPGFEKMVILEADIKASRNEETRLSSVEPFSFDVEPVDMVLTFRNYHNFDKTGRMSMNKAAFDALKSGGIYGVIDHTRRHMTPFSADQRRRIDPVLAIKEIQDAGFVLEDYSMLHYRESDDLTKEVGHETVTGNTDRWTLKFRKP